MKMYVKYGFGGNAFLKGAWDRGDQKFHFSNIWVIAKFQTQNTKIVAKYTVEPWLKTTLV